MTTSIQRGFFFFCIGCCTRPSRLWYHLAVVVALRTRIFTFLHSVHSSGKVRSGNCLPSVQAHTHKKARAYECPSSKSRADASCGSFHRNETSLPDVLKHDIWWGSKRCSLPLPPLSMLVKAGEPFHHIGSLYRVDVPCLPLCSSWNNETGDIHTPLYWRYTQRYGRRLTLYNTGCCHFF